MVFSVAGTTSESLMYTSDLLQKRAAVDLPAARLGGPGFPVRAVASMITVNNGTASAQAIARGETSVAIGSAPRTTRASVHLRSGSSSRVRRPGRPHPPRHQQTGQKRPQLDHDRHGQVARAGVDSASYTASRR